MKLFAGLSLLTLVALATGVKADTGKELVLEGTVQPSKIYKVKAEASGRIKKLYVDYNISVRPGTLLAEIEESNGKPPFKVLAPGKGVIGELDVATGQEVSAKGADGGTKLLSIFEIDEVLMVVHVNAADVPRLTPKQIVSCKVDAFPNAQFQGSIDSIEPDTKDKNSAKGSVVKAVFVAPIETNRPRLFVGMTGQLSIPLLR